MAQGSYFYFVFVTSGAFSPAWLELPQVMGVALSFSCQCPVCSLRQACLFPQKAWKEISRGIVTCGSLRLQVPEILDGGVHLSPYDPEPRSARVTWTFGTAHSCCQILVVEAFAQWTLLMAYHGLMLSPGG